MPDLHPAQFEGGQQLRMFAPVRELKEGIDAGKLYTSDNVVGGTTRPEGGYNPITPIPLSQMWRIKRREAEWEGTAQSVREEGIKRPLHIYHMGEDEAAKSPLKSDKAGTHLWDGHHRIIAAYDKDPNTEVPLMHSDEETWLKRS